MLNKRILLISAATAACALGIGFFMQPSTVAPAGSGGDSDLAGQQLPQEPALAKPISIEKITLTSANPDLADADETTASEQPTGGRQLPVAACGVTAGATALPGALVALKIAAPCRGNERITLHHQGMMVTETLGPDGLLDLVIPALSRTATFIIEPASLATDADPAPLGAVVQVAVPDMAEVDRVMVQWSGNSGFEIHAREFGAQYGENGHVWHGADPNQASAGKMVQLGDAAQLVPRLAEIYSFQRDTGEPAAQAGVIEISIEAEITEINCGREIAAQSLRVVAGRVQTRDLVLNMPDCTATGDFLVLNNLVENLKIAAR
ncbi:hypothetical protein [Pseudophaeobacter sp.]|uniref:hypothetical protein n=1 Tax=Pseudophaeobacter sp. TaxID=1971739 RepID=UPI0026154C7C|nr:hypothetical protein [Pseudophaeobacter sp.]